VTLRRRLRLLERHRAASGPLDGLTADRLDAMTDAELEAVCARDRAANPERWAYLDTLTDAQLAELAAAHPRR
jgi:hypothetical protein